LDKLPEKNNVPTIIFVGRLKRYKLPDHALKAFQLIRKRLSNAQMWVVGDGYLLKHLQEMNVEGVRFFGKVDNKMKYELMSKSHLILVPSVKEGWGLVITEANAMGTPAVAYNVSGLRDSVQHNKTGILVRDNNPDEMAEAAISLLQSPHFLNDLGKNALYHSRNFDWGKSADAFEAVLQRVLQVH